MNLCRVWLLFCVTDTKHGPNVGLKKSVVLGAIIMPLPVTVGQLYRQEVPCSLPDFTSFFFSVAVHHNHDVKSDGIESG